MLVRNQDQSSKVNDKWIGPFEVEQIFNNKTLKLKGVKSKVNTYHVKKYYKSNKLISFSSGTKSQGLLESRRKIFLWNNQKLSSENQSMENHIRRRQRRLL